MQNASMNTFKLEKSWSIENNEHQSIFSNWKSRLNKADQDVNTSVSEFVRNLGYGITDKLVNKYGNYRNNPDFSWLTDSDIWLKAIEEVYHNNQEKMPGELEKYLLNMLNLLISYKNAKGTLVTLSQVMKSEIQIKDLSTVTLNLDWQKLPPFNSRIRPADGVSPMNV